MGVVAWIVGLVVALGFVMSGAGKILGNAMMDASRDKFGFADNMWKGLGGLEVLGAVGVIIGLLSDNNNLEWIGFLAAIGLIITMVGALVYHAKENDPPKEMVGAAMMLILTVVYIIAIGAR